MDPISVCNEFLGTRLYTFSLNKRYTCEDIVTHLLIITCFGGTFCILIGIDQLLSFLMLLANIKHSVSKCQLNGKKNRLNDIPFILTFLTLHLLNYCHSVYLLGENKVDFAQG